MQKAGIFILGSLLSLLILSGCNAKGTEVFWVGGYKKPCDAGAGKLECLMVSKGKDIKKAEWQYFYAPIKGFEFKPGVAQQIRISSHELDKDEVPQDASSIVYELVEVLEEQPDNSLELNGNWIIGELNGTAIPEGVSTPTLMMDLNTEKISANDSCETITTNIVLVDFRNLKLAELPDVNSDCASASTANAFHDVLAKTRGYSLDNGVLILMNEKDKPIATMSKGAAPMGNNNGNGNPNTAVNSEIDGLWTLTQLNGAALNTVPQTPMIQFNSQDSRISGSDGCNKFTGSFTLEDNQHITLSKIAKTRRACISDEVNQMANEFEAALNKSATYQLTDANLELLDDNGVAILRFGRAN